MKLPCEICIWRLVPIIKKELVLELYSRNIKQTQISSLLHMSKAAVSHYIKGRRAKKQIISNKHALEGISAMADKLLKGEKYDKLKDDFCDVCRILQKEVLKKDCC